MLPLRDKNPSGTVPWVLYGLIALNCAAFFHELGLSEEGLQSLVGRFGLVPYRAGAALRGEAGVLGALLVPAVTSMFLHGGWAHLVANMWFLHIFGDNVEGRLGHAGFLAFYVGCGLCASGLQFALSPASRVPVIGASGAIAGVLGAYAACWPGARVVTLVPVFFIVTFVDLPALLVLGMWFLAQLLEGSASLGAEVSTGGVAYWAHIGGFAAGIGLVLAWPRRRPRPGRSRRPRMPYR